MQEQFDYVLAFSRNIGWLTEIEQDLLRSKKIAIAGLGGVGGSYLLTLTRLGVGNFNIADMDIFEQVNFNRQAGAAMSQIGREKLDVMAERALDINPQLNLGLFPEGINKENIDQFLEGVDLYIDGLDFFALEARKDVFAACAKKEIPAITAAPLGMGVALLCFMPGRMTFEEYFRLDGYSEQEQLLRFLMGLSPAMLQSRYLIDKTRLDLVNHKGPSTPMSCDLCAGFAATYALKVLLGRGDVIVAPRGLQFDAYRNKLTKTWRPWGNNNPIQQIGLIIARKILSETLQKPPLQASQDLSTPILRIIDQAKWAPSGDNTQPWRFTLIDEFNFQINAQDTSAWCVYDLDGRASQLAVGALMENISIAATAEGMHAIFKRSIKDVDGCYNIDVGLQENSDIVPHTLLPMIKTRVTQRRAYTRQSLTRQQKQQLENAVGDGYSIIWLEGKKRQELARILYQVANIYLTIPEGYKVHKRIIEWGAKFSIDKIPGQAVGLDPVAMSLMHWTIQRWARVKMLNRYFAGTFLPKVQLAYMPAIKCAAHFVLVADNKLTTVDDYLAAGRAMQRFWLTATQQGLQLQPEMAALIFSRYVRLSENFTDDNRANQLAGKLRIEFMQLLNDRQQEENRVFMGRLGIAKSPVSRSIRLSLRQLIKGRA